MIAQKKDPVERANAHGAVFAESISQGNRMIHSTVSRPADAAYRGGWESYPFSREAGQRAARLWLSGKPALSLAEFRENRWRAFTAGRSEIYPGERDAFYDGFARALAEHIAGGAHHG